MNSTTRFSDRVENYVRYRPSYPKQILSFLQRETALTPNKTIADIGSGTGISTELFLQNGYRVYAVEPNTEMRTKAEELLAKRFPNFVSVNGTAERTGLASSSIDLIVSAQAFHWFDRQKAKQEFRRIARPGAFAALIWNNRRLSTDFERAYEALLLKYGTDYEMVKHQDLTDTEVAEWFDPNPVSVHTFDNEQAFDFTGLRGRVLSSSYMPNEQHVGYAPMAAALKELFDRYNIDGNVRFTYDTKMYLGRIA
jgi:SAM-dependent methyltransferase